MGDKEFIRERFEAWQNDEGHYPVNLSRAGDGYESPYTNGAWYAWKAAGEYLLPYGEPKPC